MKKFKLFLAAICLTACAGASSTEGEFEVYKGKLLETLPSITTGEYGALSEHVRSYEAPVTEMLNSPRFAKAYAKNKRQALRISLNKVIVPNDEMSLRQTSSVFRIYFDALTAGAEDQLESFCETINELIKSEPESNDLTELASDGLIEDELEANDLMERARNFGIRDDELIRIVPDFNYAMSKPSFQNSFMASDRDDRKVMLHKILTSVIDNPEASPRQRSQKSPKSQRAHSAKNQWSPKHSQYFEFLLSILDEDARAYYDKRFGRTAAAEEAEEAEEEFEEADESSEHGFRSSSAAVIDPDMDDDDMIPYPLTPREPEKKKEEKDS